jgi:SAM-dependent methyltransferase
VSAAPANDCRACGEPALQPFYECLGIPVHSNRLLHSAEAARREPVGDLLLTVCTRCGFIQNSRYDPAVHDYRVSYEDSQGHSARFRAFAEELLAGIEERHALSSRHVLEIGCGRGDFLIELARRSAGAIGIDPSFRESEISRAAPSNARFLAEEYGAQHRDLPADFVFCRHTLEHIPEPAAFLRTIRDNLRDPGVVLYFEVPDTERILREGAFWDVYYEHCSYFLIDSLRALFEGCGFEVLRLERGFGDQYLLLEARPAAHPVAARSGASAVAWAEHFAARVAETRKHWADRIAGARRNGLRLALWGSGSKAVGFCSGLALADELVCVVDINPAKQGTFQPGAGLPIVSPADLPGYAPDVVIAMNPVYRSEIQAELDRLGVRAELLAL